VEGHTPIHGYVWWQTGGVWDPTAATASSPKDPVYCDSRGSHEISMRLYSPCASTALDEWLHLFSHLAYAEQRLPNLSSLVNWFSVPHILAVVASTYSIFMRVVGT